jgi:hypothetical protein
MQGYIPVVHMACLLKKESIIVRQKAECLNCDERERLTAAE